MAFLRTKATTALLRTLSPAMTLSLVRPALALQIRNQGTAASSGAPSHAVSAPMLADIEKRWEGMPPQEQAELWMALRDRMKGSWSELTVAEKKASYWIAFGPHGPRALDPPGTSMWIFKRVVYALGASVALFAFVRYFARSPPRTLSKEWQEASNEYLKGQKTEPITGVSSEGYSGPGMVQSKSRPYN